MSVIISGMSLLKTWPGCNPATGPKNIWLFIMFFRSKWKIWGLFFSVLKESAFHVVLNISGTENNTFFPLLFLLASGYCAFWFHLYYEKSPQNITNFPIFNTFIFFSQTNSKAFTAKTSCVRRRYSEFVWLKKKLQKNAGLV